MFDRYMSTKTELRASTRANYLEIYERYVRSEFGRKKIGEIKYSDILFFYNHLITEKNLHIGTIQYLQRLIRPSLELAVRDNIIRINPASGVIQQIKKKTQSSGSYVRHALTLEQQRAFLSFIDENPLYNRWKPLFTVLIGTGCRIGEMIGLRWEDVNMENRTIDINHSLYYFAGRRNKSPSRWVINEPKTAAGNRVIPMVDTVYTALMEEQSRQAEEVLLPQFTCHHLRHTFCTRLCEADVHIKVIQTIMGHKDIQTTMDIYAEVSEWKKKASLNEIFEQMKLF